MLFCYNAATFFLSFLFFVLINYILIKYTPPNIVNKFRKAKFQKQKDVDNEFSYFRNIFMSWIHALISGIAIFSICFSSLDIFWSEEENCNAATSTIKKLCFLSSSLVTFTMGYFVHDSYHMIVNLPSRRTNELLIHHVFGLVCLLWILCNNNRCLAFAIVSLLVEVNSIFLHTRQIFHAFEVSTGSPIYRINSIVNIVTFAVFRLGTICWQIQWIFHYSTRLPFLGHLLLVVCIPCMAIMNVILFYRIVTSDVRIWMGSNRSPIVCEPASTDDEDVPDAKRNGEYVQNAKRNGEDVPNAKRNVHIIQDSINSFWSIK